MTNKQEVERLGTFTEGVLIIAMTLLGLDVRLPRAAEGVVDADLLRLLIDLWPKYFGYVLSFLVVALYWVRSVEKFRHFVAVDLGLIWLDVVFLMVIGLIPFVTAVISENYGTVATILYAATMTLTGILSLSIWIYADRRQLIDPSLAFAERRRIAVRSLSGCVVFALSIPLALIDATLAKFFWIALLPAAWVGRLWVQRTVPPSPG